MNRPQPNSATGNYPEREQVGAWADEGLCRGLPGEWWFPTEKRKPRSEELQARRICAECPVQSQCLAHALSNRENYGIWGGKDQDERKKILRRRREARRPVMPWRDREPLSLEQRACQEAFK